MTPTARVRGLVGLVLVSTALAGCSSQDSPYDAAIVEARVAAESHVEDARDKIRFTDAVTVLGTAYGDGCGAPRNWWFDGNDQGYHCVMWWTELAVIPAARTPGEIAAALDHELDPLDLPGGQGSAVRSLLAVYPGLRDDAFPSSFGRGGTNGYVRFGVTAYPFRADSWTAHIPVGGEVNAGQVSEGGDASEVTSADVEATGAAFVIEVSIRVEYWNIEGLEDLTVPLEEAGPADVIYHTYGDAYAFEVADWGPAGGPDACLSDPTIDQASVAVVDEPFPYLRFALLPEAESLDSQRIRDCLTQQLTSGIVVDINPYE